MTWTSEPPKEPGWYWYRWDENQPWAPVQVLGSKADKRTCVKSPLITRNMEGQWQGPIKEVDED